MIWKEANFFAKQQTEIVQVAQLLGRLVISFEKIYYIPKMNTCTPSYDL